VNISKTKKDIKKENTIILSLKSLSNKQQSFFASLAL